MLHGESFPLHAIDAHRGDVQQHVDQVVGQQVDFVYVEDPTMSGGQQSRLEGLAPIFQGSLEIETSEDPILAGSQGQIDERNRCCFDRAHGAVTHFAARGRLAGSTVVGASDDALDGGHHCSQTTSCRALRTTLLPPNQHTADARIDGAQE